MSLWRWITSPWRRHDWVWTKSPGHVPTETKDIDERIVWHTRPDGIRIKPRQYFAEYECAKCGEIREQTWLSFGINRRPLPSRGCQGGKS